MDGAFDRSEGLAGGSSTISSTSFSSAVSMSLPLSSHGPAHPASLTRGKACQTCKNRKVRCDGVRPVCGACSRSAAVHGENTDKIVCSFLEPGPPPKRQRTARPKAADTVAALQARIAELEGMLPSPAASATGSSSAGATPPSATTAPPATTSAAELLLTAASDDFAFLSLPPDILFNPTVSAGPSSFAPEVGLGWLSFTGSDQTLPSPPLLHKLIDVYFSAHSSQYSGLVHEARFRQAMLLPPSHARLLHAMVLTAGRTVSSDFWADEFPYWSAAGTGSVLEFHKDHVLAKIDSAFGERVNSVAVVQAAVLLCCSVYLDANFGRIFLLCSTAVRACIPAGLNHLRMASARGGQFTDRPNSLRTCIAPTADLAELSERAMVFHFARACDLFASASTSWSGAIQDGDISTPLPAVDGSFPADDFELAGSVLSIHHPQFYTSHPAHLCGPVQMMFKSLALLGKVGEYQHSIPPPYGLNMSQAPAFLQPNTTPEFARMHALVESFQQSLPRPYHSLDAHSAVDSRVCLVMSCAHVAMVRLHEPYASSAPGDPSFEVCRQAARAIFASILSLWAGSYDVAKSVPFCNYTWAVAARTFVREIAIKQQAGITDGIEELRGNVQLIIMTMRAAKCRLGEVSASTAEILLANPHFTLPEVRRPFATVSLPVHNPRSLEAKLGGALSEHKAFQGKTVYGYMASHAEVVADEYMKGRGEEVAAAAAKEAARAAQEEAAWWAGEGA